MSGRLVGEVLQYAPIDLRMLDRFVLVALAESANDKDRIARHNSSGDAIATRICSTPSSVRNALGRLRQRGLIVPQLDRTKPGQSQEWRLVQLDQTHRVSTWNAQPGGDTNGCG